MLLRKCMVEGVSNFIESKINGSVVNTDPFPFLYVENIFPEEYYNYINSLFPKFDELEDILSKPYKPVISDIESRYTLSMYSRETKYKEIQLKPFFQERVKLREFLYTDLVNFVANKLNINLPNFWDDDTRFVLDLSGYQKRPHTDHPKKVLSILIYMSESKCGTTLLKPKDSEFSDNYGSDHNYNQFIEVFDPPFKPNTLIAFPRTDKSFHCVKKLGQGEYRKAIHINIRT